MPNDVFTIRVRLAPDEDTMKVILLMLDLWQDANPWQMVALVPAKDKYQYEIIPSGRKDTAHESNYQS